MARKKSNTENSVSNKARPGPVYLFPHRERFRLTPRTDQELDMLTHDLLLWCQQDEAISLGGFCEISGMPKARMYEAAQRHEGMREAMAVARQIICNRRERLGLMNKFNSSIVMGTYALYDPEYRAYRKELSQKEGQGESKVIVVLDKYPETEVVPDKEPQQDREGHDNG